MYAHTNLTDDNIALIKSATKLGMSTLDGVVHMVKTRQPDAFHTPNTLHTRVFFDKPKSREMPYFSFVFPLGGDK